MSVYFSSSDNSDQGFHVSELRVPNFLDLLGLERTGSVRNSVLRLKIFLARLELYLLPSSTWKHDVYQRLDLLEDLARKCAQVNWG